MSLQVTVPLAEESLLPEELLLLLELHGSTDKPCQQFSPFEHCASEVQVVPHLAFAAGQEGPHLKVLTFFDDPPVLPDELPDESPLLPLVLPPLETHGLTDKP